MYFQSQTPLGDELTALGVYVIAGLFFNFVALLEYAVILMRRRRRVASKIKSRLQAAANNLRYNVKNEDDNGITSPDGISVATASGSGNLKELEATLADLYIDQVAFIVYLSGLIIFNIIYIAYYSRQ